MSTRDRGLPAWARRALLALGPLAGGLGALLLGKDFTWDFRNYHFYNPHAFLTGRSAVDIAPAQLQSFYNPILDLPMYALVRSVPAPWVGLGMGVVQGLNFTLVFLLFLRISRIDNRPARLLAATATSLVACVAPASIIELGTGMGDNLVSLFVLAGLLAAVSGLERSADGGVRVRRRALALAGLALGLAVGLKQTAVVFALGAALALPCVVRPWRATPACVTWFGLAGLVGALLPSGHWLWALWQETGNPFFPHFNHVFRSPLVAASAFVSGRFGPGGVWDHLAWPLVFAADSYRVSFQRFTDLRFAALYLALLAVGARRAWTWAKARRAGTWAKAPRAGARADARGPATQVNARRAGTQVNTPGRPTERADRRQTAAEPPRPRGGAARRAWFDRDGGNLMIAFAVGSFVVWMFLFSVYRYLLALELLVPLCFLIALDRLAPGRRAVPAAGVLAAIALLASFSLRVPGRTPWTDRYVTLDPAGFDPPADSVVVMLGWEPMAYVIPHLPADVAWVRPGGNLWLRESHGLYQAIDARIRDAGGALYVMYGGDERLDDLRGQARRLGLDFAPRQCTRLRIDPQDDIRVCPARRLVDRSGGDRDPRDFRGRAEPPSGVSRPDRGDGARDHGPQVVLDHHPGRES